MSTFNNFSGRNRDQQDGIERHAYGEVKNSATGQTVKVEGTGTAEDEAVVINSGFGMNLPKGTNAEVHLASSGSDTNMKFATLTIPRDKQRQWKEGTSGVQNAMDPEKAVEFNDKRTHATEDNFAVGANGLFEVKMVGGVPTLYVRCQNIVFQSPPVVAPPPAFET